MGGKIGPKWNVIRKKIREKQDPEALRKADSRGRGILYSQEKVALNKNLAWDPSPYTTGRWEGMGKKRCGTSESTDRVRAQKRETSRDQVPGEKARRPVSYRERSQWLYFRQRGGGSATRGRMEGNEEVVT